MRKLVLAIVIMTGLSMFNSCTPNSLSEEETNEFIFESTDKGEVGSPGNNDDGEVEG